MASVASDAGMMAMIFMSPPHCRFARCANPPTAPSSLVALATGDNVNGSSIYNGVISLSSLAMLGAHQAKCRCVGMKKRLPLHRADFAIAKESAHRHITHLIVKQLGVVIGFAV